MAHSVHKVKQYTRKDQKL